MALSRLIRKVASGDSVRHQEGEFDLNLTYITDKVIGNSSSLPNFIVGSEIILFSY